MKRQILVTGCNGFLGSSLIKAIDKKKYILKCVSRNANDKHAIRYNNKDGIRESLKKSDVIVHLAAITDPFDRDIWRVNVDYTKFLVGEAKRHKKKFIYISTQNVLFGKDPYSESKKKAESIVKTLKNYVILRPTIIYGKGEEKYIGKLIRVIKRWPVVPVIGSGKNRLQPIYIDDMVKIIIGCIGKNIGGIFLVAGKSAITYDYLVDSIAKILKLKRIKIHIPLWIIRPFSFLLEKLSVAPPITTVQLNNLKIGKSYDIRGLEKTFSIKLIGIEQGLGMMMKNER